MVRTMAKVAMAIFFVLSISSWVNSGFPGGFLVGSTRTISALLESSMEVSFFMKGPRDSSLRKGAVI